jgi:hypothetical protein
MATVTKDFRVKAGLVVEGSTATVDGHDILTEGLVDAKGDLLVASGADAVTRVALGTNGYILTADDNETTGVKWAAAPSVGTFESSVTFEGATADSYETTLTVTDPTANRTITLPDATGTVALTSDITSAVDALDTDDIEEGTAQYFTDVRAKISAAALLTGASKTNIQITGDENGLTITAENGVADSDTDDLTEGSTNLYFTDQRAIDAVQDTTPNFTAVEINSVAKNVAGTTVVPVAGIATAYSWAKADYRSAEFLVKVAYGDHTEISKVLLTLAANDNIAITEYGIVGTNGSASSVSAVISGNDVQLQVTTVNNTSTVTVVGTLLA